MINIVKIDIVKNSKKFSNVPTNMKINKFFPRAYTCVRLPANLQPVSGSVRLPCATQTAAASTPVVHAASRPRTCSSCVTYLGHRRLAGDLFVSPGAFAAFTVVDDLLARLHVSHTPSMYLKVIIGTSTEP